MCVQGATIELDDHDIPQTLTTEEIASMTPVQLWRVLKQHGWQYKRGKHLVDWFYIRPERDVSRGIISTRVETPTQRYRQLIASTVAYLCCRPSENVAGDRNSVVQGTRELVREAIGGSR